ncbi:MAG: LamG-like jellyroll fold domain-containing protein [Candidatus Paceibacterota bacterium]|jgi:hypothetical protein
MDHFSKKLPKTILFIVLPLIFLALLIFSKPTLIHATGEVGIWHFDETSGTTASDSSGNNNSGTLTNGPVWTSGKSGNALQFDGVDDFVSMPLALNQNNWSIEGWINPTVGDNAENHVFGSSGMQVWVVNGNMFQFLMGGNYANYASLSYGTWSHVVLVADSNGHYLYVNGILRGSGAGTGNLGELIKIGSYKYGSANFNGSIDEVKIYSHALSASEVLAEYTGSSTPTPTPATTSTPSVTPTTTPTPIPVLTSISVSPSFATVQVGSTQTFIATPKDQNNNTMTGITISWTSSNNSIAMINSSGVATGVAVGTATITASSGITNGTSSITVVSSGSPTCSAIGAATYNASTNTIMLNSSTSTLCTIYKDINNFSILSYDSAINTYTLNAKIDSSGPYNLNIENTTLLMNNNVDDGYFIHTGWNLTINNSTIKSKNGKRFNIWSATKANADGYSVLIKDSVIDGGWIKIKDNTGLYYAKAGSPYVQILNTTIKNVDVTDSTEYAPSVLYLFENAGYKAVIDGLILENVHGGYVYSGTITLNSGATDASLKNIRISNSSHPYWGAIHIFGGATGVTMDNIVIENSRLGSGGGISDKEGLWNVGKTRLFKNVTINNVSGTGIYTYQNMWVSDFPSGNRYENLIVDGGAGKAANIYYQPYAQVSYHWIFNAQFKNATYGFVVRNNKLFLSNVLVQNITNMYRSLNGAESGEVNWYELADIYVKDSNNNPINGAAITIAPNTVAPVPNVTDKWFNAKTTITTGSNGHTPLPSDETGMIALLRKRDYNSGANTTSYSYTITASSNGKTASTTVTPDATWYRTDPLIPTNTITIQLATTVAPTPAPTATVDLNSDSIVNSVDFGIMMSFWTYTNKPKADLNQDGFVNSQDLGMLMSKWG